MGGRSAQQGDHALDQVEIKLGGLGGGEFLRSQDNRVVEFNGCVSWFAG